MPRHQNALALIVGLFLLVSSANTHAANIWVSLNLQFLNPTDFNSGGSWTAIAKADEMGIAGLNMVLADDNLNFDPNTGLLTPAGFEVEFAGTFGTTLQILQGDDLEDPTLDVGVIGGSFPSTYVDHPNLTVLGGNSDLGSFSGGVELAAGSFDAGDIPAWFDNRSDEPPGNDFTQGNVFVSTTFPGGVVQAAVQTTIRYVPALDGDTDADGDVDDSDLGAIFGNFTGNVGGAGGKTLADGDTDNDGDVDDVDIGSGFGNYTGSLDIAHAESTSVPEPSTAVLALLGLFSYGWRRRIT